MPFESVVAVWPSESATVASATGPPFTSSTRPDAMKPVFVGKMLWMSDSILV